MNFQPFKIHRIHSYLMVYNFVEEVTSLNETVSLETDNLDNKHLDQYFHQYIDSEAYISILCQEIEVFAKFFVNIPWYLIGNSKAHLEDCEVFKSIMVLSILSFQDILA